MDPLGDHFANPTGRLDANGIEPAGDKQTLYVRHFTQVIAVVGREALGPAKPCSYAHIH